MIEDNELSVFLGKKNEKKRCRHTFHADQSNTQIGFRHVDE